MPGAQQTIVIDTPMEFFFEVISDFESYSDFLSEVRSTRILSEDDGKIRVHYQVDIIKKVEYSLDFIKEGHHRLSWSLGEGKLMKANNGSWELEEISENQTQATYTVDVSARVFVPKAVVNMLVGSTLPATLKQFKDEAERRYQNG